MNMVYVYTYARLEIVVYLKTIYRKFAKQVPAWEVNCALNALIKQQLLVPLVLTIYSVASN